MFVMSLALRFSIDTYGCIGVYILLSFRILSQRNLEKDQLTILRPVRRPEYAKG